MNAMNTSPLILAVVLPLVAAATQILLTGHVRAQRAATVVFSALVMATGVWLLLAVRGGGPLFVDFGGWDAPVGIRFQADMLSAVMVSVTGLIAFCGAVHSFAEVPHGQERRGFHPLFFFLIFGVTGAFLTADLFNLYVWFEVMLLASFVLLALGGGRKAIEGAVKYVTLNIAASLVFLVGIGVVYGSLGTLNFEDIAQRIAAGDGEGGAGVRAAAVLLMLAFGVKAGLFPLYAWLPSSYHTPSHTVSAVFAGLLTKVGVYSLFRVMGTAFASEADFLMPLLFWVSLLTMVIGGIGAACQYHTRRILSFHIISQIGYMTFALSLGTVEALAAGIFFVIFNIFAKTNLFFAASVIDRIGGGENLKHTGGLYRTAPWLSVLFLISALGLAGIPPLSGFWGKFALIRETLVLGHGFGAFVLLATGMITLFSMTKIWAEAFWKEPPEGVITEKRPVGPAHVVPMVILAAGTVALGLYPEPFFEIFRTAAEQIQQSPTMP